MNGKLSDRINSSDSSCSNQAPYSTRTPAVSNPRLHWDYSNVHIPSKMCNIVPVQYIVKMLMTSCHDICCEMTCNCGGNLRLTNGQDYCIFQGEMDNKTCVLQSVFLGSWTAFHKYLQSPVRNELCSILSIVMVVSNSGLSVWIFVWNYRSENLFTCLYFHERYSVHFNISHGKHRQTKIVLSTA